MTTWEGVALGLQTADGAGRQETSGQTWTGAAMSMQGSPAPFIDRLGSLALSVSSGNLSGRIDASGDSWLMRSIQVLTATLAGRLDLTGQVWVGRFIPLSAVYRNADRVTLAGVALDLAGQPLRSMQLQFIGQTVQDHFFGAGTDTEGIYVAYLDTGDSYDAFAFSPTRGFVYRLDHQENGPNTTTLVFRLLTKRGGFGEGIFLQGG